MKKEITTELVRELLNYDQDTGLFTWRSRGRHWFKSQRSFRSWNTRFSGRVSGAVWASPRGYPTLRLTLFGEDWLVHRLVFLWMGEALPEQVDHLNRDSVDNRWDNLCASSQEENTKNRSMQGNNKSGVTGVHWHKPSGKWLAQGSLNGKRKHLGLFTDLLEAKRAVRAFRVENGFSVGHGEQLAKYLEGLDKLPPNS